MAKQDPLKILKQGVATWNQWRREYQETTIDLKNIKLLGADLRNVNLSDISLSMIDLSPKYVRKRWADRYMVSTIRSNLSKANLRRASVNKANLSNINFKKANFRGANLSYLDFSGADLSGADLSSTMLSNINFKFTVLKGTIFNNCKIYNCSFISTDLSEVIGLETSDFYGPSQISIDTLYKSGEKIPVGFLRGCGVPEQFISYIPSLLGANQAIQFYSCFISYSTIDQDFAKRLYSRMREANLRVWFAPEEMKGGNKLNIQIEVAIQVNDRTLIVLSENSMKSKWVVNEIRRARKTEKLENRRKLFPIRLVDYKTIELWENINPDIDVDIVEEIRTYFIPDFSDWKNHDSFEKAFDLLYRDLKTEEK